MKLRDVSLLPLAALLLSGCQPGQLPTDPLPEAAQDWSGDIQQIDLRFDLQAMQGSAAIHLDQAGPAASFEAGGIEVLGVHAGDVELNFEQRDERLDVGLPDGAAELVVDFAFEVREQRFEGLMDNGATLTWPYYCGNLFPCRSHPSEGQRFTLQVDGADAVYPAEIPFDAPAYQPAFAIGDYTRGELGTTAGGVSLSWFALPGNEAAMELGTADLVAIFEWYEDTLGPYPFGEVAGPVEAAWGPGAFGGMEHHPLWHIGTAALAAPEIHAHETAHGWYGDGVRLACWEDLVLSEGVVSYLEARVMDQAVGPEAGQAVWDSYLGELNGFGGLLSPNGVAWPDSCGVLDVLQDGIFNRFTYIKGAFFFRAVAQEVGADALDAALGDFARQRVGTAARFAELLDAIEADTGFDPRPLAELWLRVEEIPEVEL